ncbi:MAG: hypothetical protein AAB402_04515 [Patescibacteria group bacterium]
MDEEYDEDELGEADFCRRLNGSARPRFTTGRLVGIIRRRWQVATYLYFPLGHMMMRRLNPIWLRWDEWRHGSPREPPAVPQVGQRLYITSAYYIGHGEDDRRGGWVTVRSVRFEHGSYWVTVREFPESHSWNYESWLKDQAALRAEFAWRRARPDPDPRPEFHTGGLY